MDNNILTNFHPWLDSVYFKADKAVLELAEKVVAKVARGQKIIFGRMVTGEKFIEDENRAEINEKYCPLSVDMESASIAHVCYVNRVPFLAIRTITDDSSHSGVDEFEKNCMKASEISAILVKELLKEMARSQDKEE